MQLLGQSPDGSISQRGSGVSESKLKVLMTLYRKIEKLSSDSIESEVSFSIVNKVDSRS